MSRRFLVTLITIVVIATAASVAIFFAKGYTLSTGDKIIVGTGIINISSEPDAASVFIDGHLTTATNATISSLRPKDYNVKVVREGFIPWEKTITVKEGLVTPIKITLFPSIPTIYPLTFSSVANPTLSPDGSKLSFVVPSKAVSGEANKKGGIWVWTLIRNQPIAFARSAEPHQIATSQFIDFSKATLQFSPDSKQVLAKIVNEQYPTASDNYLLNADSMNSDPRDITPILDPTMKGWEEDVEAKEAVRVTAIKDVKLSKVASSSALLHWSPDETKFMARKEEVSVEETKKGLVQGIKVYDLEEEKEYELPPAKIHIWLPDSLHIILVEENSISVMDYDGTNKAVIYAGSFLDGFVFPWPDSSRLVIISSFPTPTASEPNLYGINLR